MYKYSSKNAATYSQLGIKGTTYQPGFDEAGIMLGYLKGKKVLDFGSGAGRTAQLLVSMGAKEVVGVDHNQSMINQAKKSENDKMHFKKIDETIPFKENSFDAALCAHVFVEVRDKKEMVKISSEVYKVLKPGGVFVIVTNNPKAIGRDYLSYGYKRKSNLRSGEKITCLIKKGKDSFEIDDYFWTEKDYEKSLKKAGFKIDDMSYPTTAGKGWIDESKVAPHVVIKAVK